MPGKHKITSVEFMKTTLFTVIPITAIVKILTTILIASYRVARFENVRWIFLRRACHDSAGNLIAEVDYIKP
jgi:hypothetical protein